MGRAGLHLQRRHGGEHFAIFQRQFRDADNNGLA